MREVLLILLVLLVLLGLTAFRYRRHILAAYQMWQMINGVRKGHINANSKKEMPVKEKGKLVSCVKCGTWVDESQAISFGPSTKYCSNKCVENATTTV